MVSQGERGVSAIPAHDLSVWADVLGMGGAELAKKWLYYVEPSIYQCLYREDPFAIERLPRPTRTITSAPGRPALRVISKD